jgi:hypothetical protein
MTIIGTTTYCDEIKGLHHWDQKDCKKLKVSATKSWAGTFREHVMPKLPIDDII